MNMMLRLSGKWLEVSWKSKLNLDYPIFLFKKKVFSKTFNSNKNVYPQYIFGHQIYWAIFTPFFCVWSIKKMKIRKTEEEGREENENENNIRRFCF